MSASIRRRDPDVRLSTSRPTGWAHVQRAADADLAEHRPLLAARHLLRRRRQVDLRAAQPAGSVADASGQGHGLQRMRSWASSRARNGHPAADARCRPTTINCRPRPTTSHQPCSPPALGTCTGAASRRRPAISTSGADSRRWPSTRCRRRGGLPHNNMMPYLTLNFIIALQGVFPPRP